MNHLFEKSSSLRMLLLTFCAGLLLSACSTTTTSISYSYPGADGVTVEQSFSVHSEGNGDPVASFTSVEIPSGTTITITDWTRYSEWSSLLGSGSVTYFQNPVTQALRGCVAEALKKTEPGLSLAASFERLDAILADASNPITQACVVEAAKVAPLTVQCPAKGACDKNRLPVLKPNGHELPQCVCRPATSELPACNSKEFSELDADGKPVWTTCKPAEKDREMYTDADKRKTALEQMTKQQIEDELKRNPNDPLLKSMMGGCNLVYSMVTHSYVCQ